DGLLADLAHEVPQGDVDAADGVLDGAAAALPEEGLAQLFADAHRLVGAVADEGGPGELDAGGGGRLAGGDAAETGEALVGDDFDEGVQVVVGLEFVGPAALDGAAAQAGQPDIDDLHGVQFLGRRLSSPDAEARVKNVLN